MQILDNDIDFLQFLANQESQYIEQASKWTDDVWAELIGDVEMTGDRLPWSKTHGCIALRPGEVSIWGGYNGHGKSQILGQVCAWGIKNSKWLIASMEMPPRKTMKRMVRQVTGTDRPTENYTRNFMKWTDGRLWLYDQTDTVKYERILGMVHYAAQELGIKHIVIDSLMKCGFSGGKDKISSDQVSFVDRICWAARSHNIHIHIVHHMRKGEGTNSEFIVPGKHDFRGAGEIVDLVDNAFIIHRNKRKEEKELPEIEEPDATLTTVKQRHGEYEGQFKFWYHKESMQYTADANNRTIPYRDEYQQTGT